MSPNGSGRDRSRWDGSGLNGSEGPDGMSLDGMRRVQMGPDGMDPDGMGLDGSRWDGPDGIR